MIKILIRSRDVYHETQNKLLIVLDAKCYAQVKILKKMCKVSLWLLIEVIKLGFVKEKYPLSIRFFSNFFLKYIIFFL